MAEYSNTEFVFSTPFGEVRESDLTPDQVDMLRKCSLRQDKRPDMRTRSGKAVAAMYDGLAEKKFADRRAS